MEYAKMRRYILAALPAAGIGLGGTFGASAVPISGIMHTEGHGESYATTCAGYRLSGATTSTVIDADLHGRWERRVVLGLLR